MLLKVINTTNPVTGWFEITQYNYKKYMTIVNLAKILWLTKDPWIIDITYVQGSELIGQEFKDTFLQNKYRTHNKTEN